MTRIGSIWYMEPGPAQAEIVYFVMYRLGQIPSQITVTCVSTITVTYLVVKLDCYYLFKQIPKAEDVDFLLDRLEYTVMIHDTFQHQQQQQPLPEDCVQHYTQCLRSLRFQSDICKHQFKLMKHFFIFMYIYVCLFLTAVRVRI